MACDHVWCATASSPGSQVQIRQCSKCSDVHPEDIDKIQTSWACQLCNMINSNGSSNLCAHCGKSRALSVMSARVASHLASVKIKPSDVTSKMASRIDGKGTLCGNVPSMDNVGAAVYALACFPVGRKTMPDVVGRYFQVMNISRVDQDRHAASVTKWVKEIDQQFNNDKNEKQIVNAARAQQAPAEPTQQAPPATEPTQVDDPAEQASSIDVSESDSDTDNFLLNS